MTLNRNRRASRPRFDNVEAERDSADSGSRWVHALSVVVLAFATTSCSRIDTAEWKEEVRLNDGRIVVLDARATRGSWGGPTQHRGALLTWELCYRPAKAYWKSSAAYKPDVFEIVNGKPYVVVPLRSCLLCFIHGFPSFSALVYRWEGGEWKPAMPEEFPSRVTPNLLSNVWSSSDWRGDASGFYSLEGKRRRDHEDDQTRAMRVKEFEQQVLEREKGQCPTCKAAGETVTTTRKPGDFSGTHASDGWCH